MIIAIDGPAGAGKSTIAKKIAEIINIEYIDTGAMYRAVSYKFINKGINTSDFQNVINCISETEIDFRNNHIYLDSKDVSDLIRSTEVTSLVSEVSAIKEVRDKLVYLQRKIGERKSAILDGRDIGTVVFPNADFKFFLTARPDVRALRRYEEIKDQAKKVSLEEITKSIIERDLKDTSREISPLTKADDDIEIDTSDKGIEEVVSEIIRIVKGA